MTDRVVEVRLLAPRPNLLALLAQPEFGILRNGMGTGPFKLAPEPGPAGQLRLVRDVLAPDEDVSRREEVFLDGAAAEAAIRAFAASKSDLVLGGTFADLPSPNASGCRATAFASIRRWDCSGWSRSAPAGRSTSPRFGGCCRRASTATPS